MRENLNTLLKEKQSYEARVEAELQAGAETK